MTSFWETQPVCKLDENLTNVDILENLQKNPTDLLKGMSFVELDISKDIDEICTFLRQNYGSKTLIDKNLFALMCDNYKHVLSLSIKKHDKIVAYVMICSPEFQLRNKKFMAPFVNVMCVHVDYRKKGFMQKMLQEICNRCQEQNGTFITNKQINAKPFLTSTYYQRVLNPKKVYKSGLVKVDVDIKTFMKYHEMPKEPDAQLKIRRTTTNDLPKMYEMYCKYMDKYSMHQNYLYDDFEHLLTNSIVESYMINENDFVMTYRTLLRCSDDDLVRHNVFMYTSLNNTSYMIIKNLLIVLQSNCDIVSICGNYENDIHLMDLKFTQTNDKYYWYHFNKKTLEYKELHTAATPIIIS